MGKKFRTQHLKGTWFIRSLNYYPLFSEFYARQRFCTFAFQFEIRWISFSWTVCFRSCWFSEHKGAESESPSFCLRTTLSLHLHRGKECISKTVLPKLTPLCTRYFVAHRKFVILNKLLIALLLFVISVRVEYDFVFSSVTSLCCKTWLIRLERIRNERIGSFVNQGFKKGQRAWQFWDVKRIQERMVARASCALVYRTRAR